MTKVFISNASRYFGECLKIVFDVILKYPKVERTEEGPADPILKGLFNLALLIVQSIPANIFTAQDSFPPEFCDLM